jgi:hypothetical protein
MGMLLHYLNGPKIKNLTLIQFMNFYSNFVTESIHNPHNILETMIYDGFLPDSKRFVSEPSPKSKGLKFPENSWDV